MARETRFKDFFDDYYFGTMDSKMKKAFEAALSNDPELKTDYMEFVRIVQSGELSLIKDELQQSEAVKSFLEKNFRANNSKRKRKWYWLVFGVILILAFMFFIVPTFFITNDEKEEGGSIEQSENIETQSEFKQDTTIKEEDAYTPSSPIEEQVPIESDVRVNLRIAMVNDYLKKSYFTEIQTRGFSNQQRNEISPFKECIENIRNSDYDKALKCIEMNSEGQEFKEEMWLLSLSHLGLGNEQKAIDYLNKVSSDRLNNFSHLARELLSKVD